MSTTRVPLPWPLVTFREHPARWATNKIRLLLAAVVVAYLGQLIIVSGYYLLFEVNPSMTRLWHHLVSSSTLRHTLRDNGEGLLGGIFAQAVVWNHYKKRRASTSVDAVEHRWHLPNLKLQPRPSTGQLLATPALVLLYATPGFIAAFLIAAAIRHHGIHTPTVAPSHLPAAGRSLWNKATATISQGWDQKLRGYGASLFFGHRPAKAAVDYFQHRFAERRVTRRQPPRWYHTPTFHARYRDIRDSQQVASDSHGPGETLLIAVAGATAVALAAGGWYILTFVAKP